MTSDEILAGIGAGLAAAWADLQAKQDGFRGATGRYWQGLPTHSTIPADGVEMPPDRAALAPDYQGYSWADMGGLPDKMASCLKIDQYVGPAGAGYVVTLSVIIAGDLWQEALNVGPEDWRGHGWQIVPPPII